MRFGFVLPNNWGLDDPSRLVDLAVSAEQAGIDSVWVNHHVVNVGYIADRLGNRPYHDALTVLGWVGARTERVRLGTSVLVMPYLHPLVLAKSLATMDVLSGGRMIAGLGVGSLRQENEILGVDYEQRGPRSDEFIQVMRAVWESDNADFEGRFHRLDGVVSSPQPAQSPMPIWIGGSGARARDRAARFGQGWHPMCSVNGLARRMPAFEEALDRHGRVRSDAVVAPRISVEQVPDLAAVEAWHEAGADELVIGTTTADLDEIDRGLELVAGLAAGWSDRP
jgi:probable F420-dependent oxidoreductase